jgi:CRP-like cAMP-binding protein
MQKMNLIDHLENFYPLSPEFTNSLQRALSHRKLKKGNVIYQTASIPSIWYLKSGLAKGNYYDPEGKEHITRFWKQGEIMMLAEVAPEIIQAADQITLLEDSVLSTISERAGVSLYNRFAETSKLSTKILLNDRNKSELKSYLCSLPAAAAYEEFKKVFDFERITLRDIACYLEISPEWLSGIRKNSM